MNIRRADNRQLTGLDGLIYAPSVDTENSCNVGNPEYMFRYIRKALRCTGLAITEPGQTAALVTIVPFRKVAEPTGTYGQMSSTVGK